MCTTEREIETENTQKRKHEHKLSVARYGTSIASYNLGSFRNFHALPLCYMQQDNICTYKMEYVLTNW